jgi:Na+/H+-dicarboxylate symporter
MKRLLDSLPRLGLSTWILIGLCAGIVVGLMFGEYCAFLKIVGDAFIRLLQMTILPFIVVSIIKGIGSLSVETARQLFARAGLLLLLFWGIALGIVFLLPFAFPEIESGSFFSAAMVRAPETVDFLELYIPANPFSSLTNNFVPAVVLFSISLGVALIGVKDKGVLLETLTALSDALVRVAKFVVWLTPIGVFGITASAAGTMTIQELSRLQVYFVTFNLAVLLLTFWVLPMLVSVTTPVRYYDVIRFSRVTLLTAFATDNLFIVLPLIMVNCVEIFEHYELRTPNTRAFIEVIAPVSFNFPNVATLLNLLFILFAGWFTGSTLGPGDLPRFAVSGTLSMFGGAALAIPYMLDAFRLPADLFQLYLVAGIVNSRSATMLAAMSLFSFTIISTAAMTGIMKVKWRRLAANTLAIIAALVVCLIGARTLLDRTCAGQSNLAESVRQMRLLMHPSPTTVYRTIPERVLSDDDVVAPQLRIREGGTLRVGYIANRLPYSFFNRRDELVGFDIDLVHLLADEVDCSVEFIPCDYAILPDQLDAGLFDFAVSGLPVTTESLTRMRFSDAYLEVTLALIVPDHLRQEFATMDKIRKMERVRIGVPPGSYFRKKLAKALPNAELVEIPTMRSHFEGNADVDAILADAEGGAAWTLLHPGFHVVIPEPTNVGQPLAFAVRQGNEEFVTFLSDWIKLKRSTREIDALYDHWILGRGAERREPRWCLIRDVLHWVD